MGVVLHPIFPQARQPAASPQHSEAADAVFRLRDMLERRACLVISGGTRTAHGDTWLIWLADAQQLISKIAARPDFVRKDATVLRYLYLLHPAVEELVFSVKIGRASCRERVCQYV